MSHSQSSSPAVTDPTLHHSQTLAPSDLVTDSSTRPSTDPGQVRQPQSQSAFVTSVSSSILSPPPTDERLLLLRTPRLVLLPSTSNAVEALFPNPTVPVRGSDASTWMVHALREGRPLLLLPNDNNSRPSPMFPGGGPSRQSTEDEAIGFITLLSSQKDSLPCVVHMYIQQACRDQGFGTESLKRVLSFAFATGRMDEVFLQTSRRSSGGTDGEEGAAGNRVAEKMGMRRVSAGVWGLTKREFQDLWGAEDDLS